MDRPIPTFKIAVSDEEITAEHMELAQLALHIGTSKWMKGGEQGELANFVALEVARVIATVCIAVGVDFQGTMLMPKTSEN